MTDAEIDSPSFRAAELRSERTRIAALLTVYGSLLVLLVVRAVMALSHGRHGEAWPFAVLLAAMTGYELVWLRAVQRAIAAGRTFNRARWMANILIESLLLTAALLLETNVTFAGPQGALTSPVVLGYLLLITLSTLHLDPLLSHLAGVFSAAGYAAVSLYVFVEFPNTLLGGRLLSYGTSFSCVVFLLLGGFAAGAVAHQIRLYVLAALREAEARTKVAELEHDLDMARSIQQGLLPKTPPKVDGFDIAGWNQPASETGGDYYDWQQLSDGRLAITVADVTGHGIGPALAMSACRAYARAGLVIEPNLCNFLGRLNPLLYQDLPPEKFVTMVTGLLAPADCTLQMISGGHGPQIFYSAALNQFATYDAQGPPLGLFPNIKYGCAQVLKFAPGDILVFLTDGFLEWANVDDEDFGQERLKNVILACRDMPAAKIISELYSAVVEFAGPVKQADDLTALVVKCV